MYYKWLIFISGSLDSYSSQDESENRRSDKERIHRGKKSGSSIKRMKSAAATGTQEQPEPNPASSLCRREISVFCGMNIIFIINLLLESVSMDTSIVDLFAYANVKFSSEVCCQHLIAKYLFLKFLFFHFH
jgi:hypothetical protein